MPSPFFIQNPATKFVIDIAENPAQSGDLDAFTKKGSLNQLWTFVSFGMVSYVNYYFLENPQTGLVIAIDGPGVTSEGTLEGKLTAPAKLLVKPKLDAGSTGAFGDGYPKNWNQLWGFLPDGLGHYWIVNPPSQFVIDIAEGNRPILLPGTLLDAYTQKTGAPRDSNQLWTFIPQDGNPPVSVPPLPSRRAPVVPPQTGNPVQK
jgi:Ricin-type beta-trefoil lectin domain-like